MSFGPLGAAETYVALIYAQGGERIWTRIPRLVSVKWGRVLDDYSEASVTIAKADVDADTANRLGNTHAWGHELSIYRDNVFVWQGPIIAKSEFGDRFELEARDMLAWLDRRRNPKPWNWTEPTDQNPGGWGAVEVGALISSIIHQSFEEHDPGFIKWLHVGATDPPQLATLQAMQTRELVIGDAVRDLVDYGMDVYTIGRKIYSYPEHLSRARPPVRLTENDFGSDIELREVGMDAATRAVVLGTQPQNEVSTAGAQPASDRAAPVGVYPGGAGAIDPFYGLIEYGLKAGLATTQAAVNWLARALARYNQPPVMSIVVPSSASLSPEAPVSIHDLVPAQRVFVRLLSYTTPVVEEFLLNELEVSAAVSGGAMSEQVSISVTSKRDATEAEMSR